MNAAFKKFRLVEEDEFQRGQRSDPEKVNFEQMKRLRDYNPELMSEVRQRQQVSDLLEDNSLPPDIKLQRISYLLRTLKNFDPNVEAAKDVQSVSVQPTTGQPNAAQQPAPPPAPKQSAVLFKDLAMQVPHRFKTKANELGEFLDKHPEKLAVGERNELVIHGKPIPFSNAYTAFKFLYNPAAVKAVPVGYSKLVTTLGTMRVPSELVSNKNLKKILADSSQTGEGKKKERKVIGFAKRPKPHAAKINLKLYKI